MNEVIQNPLPYEERPRIKALIARLRAAAPSARFVGIEATGGGCYWLTVSWPDPTNEDGGFGRAVCCTDAFQMPDDGTWTTDAGIPDDDQSWCAVHYEDNEALGSGEFQREITPATDDDVVALVTEVEALHVALDHPRFPPTMAELAAELRALVSWVEAETDGRDWPHERLAASRALLARLPEAVR